MFRYLLLASLLTLSGCYSFNHLQFESRERPVPVDTRVLIAKGINTPDLNRPPALPVIPPLKPKVITVIPKGYCKTFTLPVFQPIPDLPMKELVQLKKDNDEKGLDVLTTSIIVDLRAYIQAYKETLHATYLAYMKECQKHS